ncbi:FkbM family methyltransferase [Prauserella cavernicola]|uniref:FkbM family methyltransferase n=1 Tax=Prauserella cavernicola TaxID=2800127 RepID=A0A934QU23_9PSEU|nr:FkbM family methyltransferase [Prauserella cavernicola]MBK1786606.1 FkbM family methyltransferase [Prauserella cavernicola]
MPELTLQNGITVDCVHIGETYFLHREIFMDRCYLGHGITIPPGGVVFDVGANIGMFAVQAALEAPDVTVYAFEPGPLPYAALEANIARHGVKAVADRAAVSDTAGSRKLIYYPGATLISGFYPGHKIETGTQIDEESSAGIREYLALPDDVDVKELAADMDVSPETIDTRVVRLSDVFREQGVTKVDLLKVDVEKAELEVLRGVEDDDWAKIGQVVVEVEDVDGSLGMITSLLASKGFTVVVEENSMIPGYGVYLLTARRMSEVK